MSKVTVDLLTTELCRRLGWDTTPATVPRADALLELDRAEKYIQQRYSLDYLTMLGSAVVVSASNTSPIPTGAGLQMDIGKDFVMQNSDGNGEMTYIPTDEWYETANDTYALWTTTKPLEFTIIASAGVPTFYFRPSNTTGGSLTFPLIYQLALTALIDANVGTGSTSLLPEGWEKTILLDRAEANAKRIHHRLGWEELLQKNESELEIFYQQYRTTKERPWPDREQQERKVSRDKLDPGAP